MRAWLRRVRRRGKVPALESLVHVNSMLKKITKLRRNIRAKYTGISMLFICNFITKLCVVLLCKFYHDYYICLVMHVVVAH